MQFELTEIFYAIYYCGWGNPIVHVTHLRSGIIVSNRKTKDQEANFCMALISVKELLDAKA